MRLVALIALVVFMVNTGCGGVTDKADSGPNKDMVKAEDTTKPTDSRPDKPKGDVTVKVDGVKPNPDVTKPDASKPDVTKPDASKPDVTKPDASKSDVMKPDGTVKPKPDGPAPDTTALPKCGDSTINGTEKCDGTNLGGKTCASFSPYHSGTLKCNSTCTDFDKTGCNKCGDGKINGSEKCDGALLGGATCTSQGFDGGTLGCTSCAHDTTKCSTCGDGKVTGSEQCDGTALGGKTCKSLGLVGGTLKCVTSTCKFNKTYCTYKDTYGTWAVIPAGTFQMGSPTTEKCRSSNETQHKVTLTQAFEIAVTETTQAQFKALMGYSPSGFASCGTSCPVEKVSWHEAAAYCNALSTKVGKSKCYSCTGTGSKVTCKDATAYSGSKIYTCPGYRLPTEAEWEYAYRAGTTTAFYNGNITKCSGLDPNADKIGWFWDNASKTTHPVAKKTANAWGLYDMAGNGREWCHDGYKVNLGSAAQTDPVGSGSNQVYRGGGWDNSAEALRAARRLNITATARVSTIGFRPVRTLPPKTKWVTIKAGTFQMGALPGEKCNYGNETQHKVTLTRDFEMEATETTQAQFSHLMSYNPSDHTGCGPSCPVEKVTWHEAAAYCNALSKQAGKTACYSCPTGSKSSISCKDATSYTGSKIYTCPGYRLPTEAEWEYAYRASTTTPFYNGNWGASSCIGCAMDANAEKIGWHCSNAAGGTHPVAQKAPNKWGLYDMAGNVMEFVHDVYKADLGSSATVNPVVFSGSTTDRVVRNGAYDNGPAVLRASVRHTYTKSTNKIGLRCVRTIKP